VNKVKDPVRHSTSHFTDGLSRQFMHINT